MCNNFSIIIVREPYGRQDIRLPFSILSHHGTTILQTKIYLCHSLPQGF